MEMKNHTSKIIALLLCAALVFALAACGEKNEPAAETETAETAAPAVANPVHECTAQELVEVTGLSFAEPAGAEELTYSYIDGAGDEPQLAQMRFLLDGLDCTARARRDGLPGEELPDISGLYYDWTETSEVTVGYNDATLRLSGCEVGYVTWYDYAPGILYSVSMVCPENSNAAVTAEALVKLAAEACPPLQGDADGDPALAVSAPFFKEDELPVNVTLGTETVTIAVTVERFDASDDFGIHTVTVTDEAGSTSWGETGILDKSVLWLVDVDGDGFEEIFLSGDCGSDDYMTYGWRFANGALESLSFAGDTRRCSDGAAVNFADAGIASANDDGTMVLGGFTYMLGTYGSEATYRYSDGVLSPVDGLWCFPLNEYLLETAVQLSDDLPAGTKLTLTDTNGSSMSYKTESGETGTLAITIAPEGNLVVNGIPEDDAFTFLPYVG